MATEKDVFAAMLDAAEQRAKDDPRTFEEVFGAVRYKKFHHEELSTDKEKLMDDLIKEWAETFGYESV